MGRASSLPLARRAKFAVTDFGLRPMAGWKPAPLKGTVRRAYHAPSAFRSGNP